MDEQDSNAHVRAAILGLVCVLKGYRTNYEVC